MNLALMIAFFSLTLPQQLWAIPLRCEKVFDSEFQNLSKQLKDRETTLLLGVKEQNISSSSKSYHLQKLSQEVLELLDKNNIQYRFINKSQMAIEILAVKDGAWINRLAYGIKKNYRQTKIIFDPKEFINSGTLGYARDPSAIFIDSEALIHNQMTPLLAHEIRHMKNYSDFLKGQFDDSMSLTSAIKNKKIIDENAYHDYLFSDEIHTYIKQLFEMAQEPIIKNDSTSRYVQHMTLIQYSQIGQSINAFLYENTSRHLDLVTRLINRPHTWKENELQLWESGQNKIELLYEQHKGLRGQLVNTTVITVQDQNFSTDYQFRNNIKTRSVDEWMISLQERLERSLKRYKKFADHWVELDSAIYGENQKKTINILRQMRQILDEERADQRKD